MENDYLRMFTMLGILFFASPLPWIFCACFILYKAVKNDINY